MYFRDWWDDDLFDSPRRTSRLFDQQFGTGIFPDDLQKMASSFHTSNLRSSRLGSFRRPWSDFGAQKFSGGLLSGNATATTTSHTVERLQINLDVQQFTPHEITVKTVNNSVVVEGKHDERQDEHGFIARHFVRRYVLPDDHDPKDVVSSLSSDGVLTILSPKKPPPPPPTAEVVYERTVPIQRIEERTTETLRTTSESVSSECNGK